MNKPDKKTDRTVNWTACKLAYVTDENASYRTVAEQYGVSPKTLASRAKRDGWRLLRTQYRQQLYDKAVRDMAASQTDHIERLQTVTDRLLDQIEQMVAQVTAEGVAMDKQCLKQITGALKDIKAIQLLRAEGDIAADKGSLSAAGTQNGPVYIVDDMPEGDEDE